jgi:hypothetical protein
MKLFDGGMLFIISLIIFAKLVAVPLEQAADAKGNVTKEAYVQAIGPVEGLDYEKLNK